MSNSSVHGTFDGAFDGALAEKLNMTMTHTVSKVPRRVTTVSPPEPFVGMNNPSTADFPDEQHSTLPVYSHLTSEIMDYLKDQVIHDPKGQPRDFSFVVDFDSNRRFRPAKPFVNRSLYYTLSNPETLLKSFRDQNSPDFMYSPLAHLDSYRLSHAFRDWTQRNGALVFDSLHEALEALFRPPPELDTQKSPRLKPSLKDAASSRTTTSRPVPGRYLSNIEVAHIVMVCIHALTSSVSMGWPHTWVHVRKLRGWGVVIPGATPNSVPTDKFVHPWLEIVDELEYEPAVRLATRLLQAIGTRRCYEHMLATTYAQNDQSAPASSYIEVERLLPTLLGHLTQVEKAALHRKRRMSSTTQNTDDDPGWTVTATLMEWLRTIIVHQWDGNVEINKWSSVGTAVTLMTHLRQSCSPIPSVIAVDNPRC